MKIFIKISLFICFFLFILKTDAYLEDQTRSTVKAFTNIYRNNVWGVGSGPGSYAGNTKEYRYLLQSIFNNKHIKTYVDLGCGDWQIMRLIKIPENKKYVGVDVVKSVIDNNKKEFSQKNIDFQKISGDFANLPRGDILIVKDVLQHLPREMVWNFIDKVLPHYKYALITHDTYEDIKEEDVNRDILPGHFTYFDLTHPPYNLKNLQLILTYSNEGGPKRVYLYTNPNFKA